MRTCVRLRVLSLLLLTAASAAISLAQIKMGPVAGSSNAPAQDDKRYVLTGSVVNSVSGEPIRRAQVTIHSMQQLTVMTDADGHFEFDDLPRSRVALSAMKPGFFSDQELGRMNVSANQVDVGPDAASPTIKLVPEAVIAGRVVDTDGFPVPRIGVRVVGRKIVNGRKNWQVAGQAITDFDGQFRIFHLTPGAYYVIAGPGRQPAMVTGAGDDPLEMGFAAVRYPPSSGEGNPATVNVAAGQQLQVDFKVKPEKFYQVSGSVAGIPPGWQAQLRLTSDSPVPEGLMPGTRVEPDTGIFTLPRVAPGSYLVMATAYTEGGGRVTGSVPLTVRGNVNGLQVALQPTLEIPVHVRDEGTREKQPSINQGVFRTAMVQLIPENTRQQGIFAGLQDQKDPSSPMVLKNVSPGRYRAEVKTFGTNYVALARYGSIDLMAEDLVVPSSGAPGSIDIVTRDDGPKLTFKVQAGTSQTEIISLVVPDRGEPSLMQMGSASGEFNSVMSNLRPGRYTILAFDDVSDLEYTSREALEPYFSKGTRVTLAAGQESSVTVNLIRRRPE